MAAKETFVRFRLRWRYLLLPLYIVLIILAAIGDVWARLFTALAGYVGRFCVALDPKRGSKRR